MTKQLDALLGTLQAAADRQRYNRHDFFKPYPKQFEFFAMGSWAREKMLIAGNQLGKCCGYNSLIEHPDGTVSKAGILFERGRVFSVWAWDGKKRVDAQVTAAFRKPPEPMVRLWMRSGRWFECALDHRVWASGSWRFVREILPDLQRRLASTQACDPLTQLADGPHSFGNIQGWIAHCAPGFRPYGGQPLVDVTDAQGVTPLQGGAPLHSPPSLHLDVPLPTHTSSGHHASPGGQGLHADLISGTSGRGGRGAARPNWLRHQGREQQPLGLLARLRSAGEVLLGRGVSQQAWRSPVDGDQFIAYEPIASQAVYDFTVPVWNNYVSQGIVHHNSEAGAYETTCHLTGEYPDWWTGRRWNHPTKGWIAGETASVVRDVQQMKLCGEPGVAEAFGTGMIPKAKFTDQPSLSRGVTDAYDTIQVRHKSGGVSVGRFKSYEQGRQKFQGDTLDWIWADEEVPMPIYSECLTRVTATNGMVFATFTPLKGRTDLVMRFLDEPSEDRGYVTMTIYDVKHVKDVEKVIAGYPPHEREARVNGTPMMGSGRVFAYPEDLIREAPMEYVPDHWPKLWGTDFGLGHPFAATLILWDKDNDVIHVHATVKIKVAPGQAGGLPINHAAAMKTIGAAVPVAWPHDGSKREHDGSTIAAQYRKQGLLMLGTHATFVEGGYGTEAGILEMDQRMQNGKFKVAAHLSDWWEEYRNYHRKDGLVVKVNDDLMSATRIAVMQRRSARLVNLGGRRAGWDPVNNVAIRSGPERMAEGLDFDVFAS